MRARKTTVAALPVLLAAAVPEARAQMTLVETIDLVGTTAEADALEVNRTFNEIYVVDFNGSRGLHVYDLSFNLLRNIPIASPGYGVPEGVTRDPASGDFFLPTHSGTVHRFSATGAFVGSFPVGGAGNGLAFDPADSTLWISHFNTETVEHRALDGTFLSSFNPPTLDSLVGLALDPVTGTLFVAANGSDEVHEYTKAGAFVANVLPGGAYPNNGLGIYYDCVTRKLYYGGQSTRLLVYRDTSRVACGASQTIADVRAVLAGYGLAPGIAGSLDAKLAAVEAAMGASNAENRQDAANKLGAFINAVQAQSGKALTPAQADELIAWAQRIQASL